MSLLPWIACAALVAPTHAATPSAVAQRPHPAGPTKSPQTTAQVDTLPTLDLCSPGAADCECVALPAQPTSSCWDRGERWSHGGCKPATTTTQAKQCCGGRWAGAGSCGACSCSAAWAGSTSQGGGCIAPNDTVRSCAPPFRGSVHTIDEALAGRMRKASWRPGCPVPMSDLRRVSLRHVRPDGTIGEGELIVAAPYADAIVRVFARLYRHRFPITSMKPMHTFGGSDDASMAVDNTSAFNCRPITGGKGWSEHSYGRAIDINPLRNPYLRGSLVLPPAGKAWTQRVPARPGMLVDNGPVVGAFAAIGWSWGGHWRNPVDLQHLSSTGK